jgi:hypothetical protein
MFFLVTGASGVGKSTVRRLLEPALAGRVETCELATLGLTPEWSLRWRHQAIEQAVIRALQAQKAGVHFLLCGDPVPPGELYAVPSASALEQIEVCLLDVSKEAQIQRLTTRGDAPELIPQHVAFAEWMRHHVADPRYRPEVIIDNGWEKMCWDVWTAREASQTPWRCSRIDTTDSTPDEVAEKVRDWIERHISARESRFCVRKVEIAGPK